MSRGPAWCGACGLWDRQMTDDEAAERLRAAVRALDVGHDPLAIMSVLAESTEQVVKSKLALCACRPVLPPAWSTAPAGGFHLYRLWAEDCRLLYVGVSVRLRNRLKAHQRRWGDLIASVTWEEHPDAWSMLEAERVAVRDECPALNKALV